MQRFPVHTGVELVEGLDASLDVFPALFGELTPFADEADRRVGAAVMAIPDDL
jgi:hypothetical protein